MRLFFQLIIIATNGRELFTFNRHTCVRLSSFYTWALDFNYFRVGMDNTAVSRLLLLPARGAFTDLP